MTPRFEFERNWGISYRAETAAVFGRRWDGCGIAPSTMIEFPCWWRQAEPAPGSPGASCTRVFRSRLCRLCRTAAWRGQLEKQTPSRRVYRRPSAMAPWSRPRRNAGAAGVYVPGPTTLLGAACAEGPLNAPQWVCDASSEPGGLQRVKRPVRMRNITDWGRTKPGAAPLAIKAEVVALG